MKKIDPKNSPNPVSRPSNEEIETDGEGRLISTRETYAGNADETLLDFEDEENAQRKNKSGNLGVED